MWTVYCSIYRQYDDHLQPIAEGLTTSSNIITGNLKI